MRILLSIATLYTISYLPKSALWSYRHDESFKENPVNVVTNTESTFNDKKYPNTSNTGEIGSTTEKILSAKDKGGTNINNKNESTVSVIKMDTRKTKDTFLSEDAYYDYFDMLHYYQLSVIEDVSSYTCTEKNERHALLGRSQNYIECMNGTAYCLECLNGLHVDPEKVYVSPCQYAIDVPNTGKAIPRRKPTSECPHDFGYYKIEDKHNCSSFRICEFGVGYDYECPNGLAFRSDTLRCDWPHKVPECDAEAYANFVCPDKKLSLEYYGSPVDCREYFVCIQGVPRRQVCEQYMGFHLELNYCVPADNVETFGIPTDLVTTLWIQEGNETFINQVDKSANVLNKLNQNYSYLANRSVGRYASESTSTTEKIRNRSIHQDDAKHNNISEIIGTTQDNDEDCPRINRESEKIIGTIKNDTRKSIQDIFMNKNEYNNYVDNLYYHQLSVRRSLSNYTCIEKNGRYALPGSSEEYIECKNGTATHMQCLDGLHFDYEKANEKSPCQYSIDISGGKKLMNHHKQTGECPHQFGYYKIEDAHNCSSFRICEFGIGYDFKCPNGLAFRSDTLRCDWPHKVPECNAAAYADFSCPDNKPSFQFYRSPTNCQVHYICIHGVPRRQVCEKYMGFDLVSNCCVPADRVKSCDQQIQLLASQYRKDKLQKNFHSDPISKYDDGDSYFNFRSKGLSFERRLYGKAKVIS
ncbi:unnamed protein product, partial [Brenthis ino]